jgi:hypothetical protein
MNITHWHRDTSLLALSLSIDSALSSKEEYSSETSDKSRSRHLGSNSRTIVEYRSASRASAFKESAPSEPANPSHGFRRSHAQSGLPAA